MFVSCKAQYCSVDICMCFVYCSVSCVSTETCNNESLENIANQTQLDEIEAYTSKLSEIKGVLARNYMKVAFFGRWVCV